MEISDENVSIVLDSSVWVAYLHKEDSQHKKARALLNDLALPLIVPAEVLSETATALRNKKRDDLAKGFVQQVMYGNLSLLVHNEQEIRDIAETFLSRSDKLSFVDTALLILSREYRIITFDKALAKAFV